MNFLEAKRIVAEFGGGPSLPFLFATSGTAEPIELYLKAAAAKRGRSGQPRFLPFNTLRQHLLATPGTEPEVIVLLPWDLVAELDWRSGVPGERLQIERALDEADAVLRRTAGRSNTTIFYLPAPVPPVLGDQPSLESFQAHLTAKALGAGASLLAPQDFSLGSYLASGLPIAPRSIGRVAELVVEQITKEKREPAKVLVTDLDNTMWHGVIAEDGLEGIAFSAEGAGYKHFIYQTLLRRLKNEGVLLAAVSRNSPDVAMGPIKSGRMTLGEDDFVAVIATYHSKSAQIQELARQLNLGLDSFVFVDDNEIELQEVSLQLPAVQCLPFPRKDEDLPALFGQLMLRFGKQQITAEDAARTALYRQRLQTLVPQNVQGADLVAFLRDLRMRLIIHDRSGSDRTRAVQLINKTNQFNLNGRRVTDDEVAAILAGGGRLLTATLEDRTGSHGEILSMLISAEGVVVSFVLSCRVFQRRVESAFCVWLAQNPGTPTAFAFAPTPRNEPFQLFAADPAFTKQADGTLSWNAEQYAQSHAGDLELFELVTPVNA